MVNRKPRLRPATATLRMSAELKEGFATVAKERGMTFTDWLIEAGVREQERWFHKYRAASARQSR
jgi:hypothetical protein